MYEEGGTSGLLVKVLACNRKVAGSSPTRIRLFSPMSVLSSTLKNEEVFITASFGGDVKPSVPGSWLILATCAILASSLSHIWSKHSDALIFRHTHNYISTLDIMCMYQ